MVRLKIANILTPIPLDALVRDAAQERWYAALGVQRRSVGSDGAQCRADTGQLQGDIAPRGHAIAHELTAMPARCGRSLLHRAQVAGQEGAC